VVKEGGERKEERGGWMDGRGKRQEEIQKLQKRDESKCERITFHVPIRRAAT